MHLFHPTTNPSYKKKNNQNKTVEKKESKKCDKFIVYTASLVSKTKVNSEIHIVTSLFVYSSVDSLPRSLARLLKTMFRCRSPTITSAHRVIPFVMMHTQLWERETTNNTYLWSKIMVSGSWILHFCIIQAFKHTNQQTHLHFKSTQFTFGKINKSQSNHLTLVSVLVLQHSTAPHFAF